ncbi:MAG: hypothetical protein MUF44_12025, partial [Hydrogenophaga sp.]|nr:hypothetical protein [Hydrogenophaga sp.]
MLAIAQIEQRLVARQASGLLEHGVSAAVEMLFVQDARVALEVERIGPRAVQRIEYCKDLGAQGAQPVDGGGQFGQALGLVDELHIEHQRARRGGGRGERFQGGDQAVAKAACVVVVRHVEQHQVALQRRWGLLHLAGEKPPVELAPQRARQRQPDHEHAPGQH